MHVRVVDPPVPAIPLAKVKARLRVEGNDEDADIADMLEAATAHFDGPDGVLGRCIRPQTLELTAASFGDLVDGLPFGPVISIESVAVIAPELSAMPLDGSLWRQSGDQLLPGRGLSWPTTASDEPDAVTVRYRAGFEELPAKLAAAILLTVGDFYTQRESFIAGTIATAAPVAARVTDMIAAYRVWR